MNPWTDIIFPIIGWALVVAVCIALILGAVRGALFVVSIVIEELTRQ